MFVQPVRVGETSTTTGTGAYTLAGAIDSGFATFLARLGAGTSRVHYAAYSTAGYEVGVGEFNGSNQLSRSQIIRSSNSDAAVNWSAGTKTIIALWPSGPGYYSLTGDMSASTFLTLADAFVVFSTASVNATVFMPPLASVPPGFAITFRNSDGVDLLTLDPDGTEQIEGASTWVIYPGQTVTVLRTPSAWQVLPIPQRKQIVTAWVRFSSTGGAPTIADSHRVTSVSRSGAGQYTVNFSTAMPDTNYAVFCTPQRATNNFIANVSASSISTGSFSIIVTAADGTTLTDVGMVNVLVLGAGA